jgi:hypothetical protein
MSCAQSDHNNMSASQKAALEERNFKSISLVESLKESEIKRLTLNSEFENIQFIKILEIDHEADFPILQSSKNFYFFNEIRILSDKENIHIYNKKGKFIKKFGEKGRGPNELQQVYSIAEKDSVIYLSDNGNLKTFNLSGKEISRKFIGIWANKINILKNSIDFKSSHNNIFAFPVLNYSKEKLELNFAIKDIREDGYGFKSTNSTTFFSNDSIIIYAHTNKRLLHIFDKTQKRFIEHYELEADFIRKNTKKLKKNAKIKEFTQFISTVFSLKKIHWYKNNIYILFQDNLSENKQNSYISRLDLRSKKSKTKKIENTQGIQLHFEGNKIYSFFKKDSAYEISEYSFDKF